MAVYMRNPSGRKVGVEPRRVDDLLRQGFELLEATAPAEPVSKLSLGVVGGGWYAILDGEDELDRVRGKVKAEARRDELQALRDDR